MKLKHASLCTGYGGLDLAAEALIGGEMVWCAEWEDAPSEVIEARYPGVPNVRDVRAIPWRILSAAAVGACHRRERLFIYAQPLEHVAQPAGPVLAVVGEEGWLAAEEDLFGERDIYREPLPVSGVMRDGRIYSVAMEQPPIAGPLFPTPDASVANDGEGVDTWLARREKVRARGINVNGMGMPLTIAVQMLPTPTTQDAVGSGGSNESNVTLTDAVVRTEMGTRPSPRLLPTPTTQPDTGNGHARSLGGEVRLLPTPEAKLAQSGPDYARAARDGSGGHDLITAVALLPTPYAYEGQRGGVQDPAKRREGGHSVALSDVVAFELLQTPTAALAGGVQTLERQVGGRWAFEELSGSWGKYAAAVGRHARMLGMAPPSPTRPNTKGNPELSPAFVEWMMCLEPGRVTDPTLWTHLSPRKAREVQLRMLGNGVVPPQALAAYQQLGEIAAIRPEGLAS